MSRSASQVVAFCAGGSAPCAQSCFCARGVWPAAPLTVERFAAGHPLRRATELRAQAKPQYLLQAWPAAA